MILVIGSVTAREDSLVEVQIGNAWLDCHINFILQCNMRGLR
jgi:hypothetical protein